MPPGSDGLSAGPKSGQGSQQAAQEVINAYTGKVDNYVPVFSGKQTDYKDYRRRCDLYAAKMTLANRNQHRDYADKT